MKAIRKLISISNIVFFYVLTIVLLLFISPFALANSCTKLETATLASVARVIDADTLELMDGRRIRLIGIDAPELGYRGQQDEPFAREGKRALEQKLASVGNRIWVQLGQEPKDRYDRLLADLFFPDESSVQGWLLEQGWAMQVFIAPNLEYADCLQPMEQIAQQAQRGIWSLTEYSPGIRSTQVPQDVKGAVIVLGEVQRVGSSRTNLWLNLDGGVAIQVPRASLDQFTQPIKDLHGKTVRVRGWIIQDNSPHHQWRIRIQDGRSLEIIK